MDTSHAPLPPRGGGIQEACGVSPPAPNNFPLPVGRTWWRACCLWVRESFGQTQHNHARKCSCARTGNLSSIGNECFCSSLANCARGQHVLYDLLFYALSYWFRPYACLRRAPGPQAKVDEFRNILGHKGAVEGWMGGPRARNEPPKTWIVFFRKGAGPGFLFCGFNFPPRTLHEGRRRISIR